MIIELDDNGVVLAAPGKSGDWYPDDTLLAQESAGGRPLAHGPIKISMHQPEGWAERAGRVWQDGRWMPTEAMEARRQAAVEKAALRERARKREGADDMDLAERVADLEKRLALVEATIRPGGPGRG